jgi:hypothetical protein
MGASIPMAAPVQGPDADLVNELKTARADIIELRNMVQDLRQIAAQQSVVLALTLRQLYQKPLTSADGLSLEKTLAECGLGSIPPR